jgi:hypothetical protein
MLFSALMLFGTFKGRKENQATVDDLLRAEDPSLSYLTWDTEGETSRNGWTAARNGFAHAEGRGKNPASASVEIRRLSPTSSVSSLVSLLKGWNKREWEYMSPAIS